MRLFLTAATCALLLTGCETDPPTPQLSGTVSAVFASYPGQGAHQKLKESGRINAGLHDDASKSNGWEVTLDWSMPEAKTSIATYRFNWSYTLDSGEPVAGSSDISYDGLNRAVAVVDDQFTIEIDPRTLRSAEPPGHKGTPVVNSFRSLWADGS